MFSFHSARSRFLVWTAAVAAMLVGMTLLWADHVQAEEGWTQVEDSFASGPDVSTFVEGNTVYVAHTHNPSGKLSVRKYENGEWVQVGPETITDRSAHRMAIYVYQGVPYVAFVEYPPFENGGVTALKYDADLDQWVLVGPRTFFESTRSIGTVRLAVDNGNIYAAFQEAETVTSFKTYVMKYNPDTDDWEELGGDEPLDRSVSVYRGLEMQAADGVVYVTRQLLSGSADYLLVHKFDDTAPDGRWEDVTGVAPEWLLESNAFHFGTRIYQSKPYSAYVNFYGETLVLMAEQNWQKIATLGNRLIYGNTGLTSPVIRWHNGLMYVAYTFKIDEQIYLTVARYDGSQWTALGDPIAAKDEETKFDHLSLHIDQGVLALGAIEIGKNDWLGQYKMFTYTDSIELDVPPAVAADPEEKGVDDAFVLTFEENEEWKERIERITVDGKTIYKDVDYTIGDHTITIHPGVLKAGFQTINIIAEGYLGVTVVQKVNPHAPKNVWVQSVGDSFMKLAWTEVPGADAYRIYYGTSPNPRHAADSQFIVAPYNLVVKESVISALENGTTYYLAMTTVADGLESPPSADVTGVPSGKTDERNQPWQLLDGRFQGNAPSLFLDGDIVYVAYREGGAATVLKFEEERWTPVGDRQFSVGNGYDPSIYVDQQVPYVAFGTHDQQAVVMKFDGEEWVQVGNAPLSTEESHHFSMAVHEGVPYVAYVESGAEEGSWYYGAMKVKQLAVDGAHSGEWVAMGDASLFPVVRSDTVMLRYDGGHHLFVTFLDENEQTVRLYQWDLQADEPAWQEVELPEAIGSGWFVSMIAANDSIYYLISKSGGQPGGQLELWVYDRVHETWSNLGGGFPGNSGALALDQDIPHVAYYVRNEGSETEAAVQKYVNGHWYPFGSNVYPQGTAMWDLDLAVNNYKPYVVYSNNGGSVEVRTLPLDSWCTVTLYPHVEGSAETIVSLPCGEPLSAPVPSVAKPNYYFEYWTADGEVPFDFTQRIETSIALKAVWNLFEPKNVKVAAHGDGTLTLEWDAVAGATRYRVYRGESDDRIESFVDEVTEPTFTDTGLTNGTVYYYAVTATDGIVESKRSAVIDGKPRTVPQPPQDVEAELIEGPAVVLTFAKPEDGGSEITGYKVMVVPDEDSGLDAYPYGQVFEPETAEDESVELEIEGLEYNIGYRFQVAALNSEGISGWSALTERVVPRLSCSYLLYNKDGTDAIERTQPCLDPVDNTKVRTGFRFAGWYVDDAVTNAFVPTDDHAGETVPLYAKWIRTDEPLPANEWIVLDQMVDQKYHLHSIVHQGRLYSALWDDGYLTVREHNGEQWVTVGSPRFVQVNDMALFQKAVLFIDDEVLYVAYNVDYSKLQFSRILLNDENRDWENAWDSVEVQFMLSEMGFVVHREVPYLAYSDVMGFQVMKWTDGISGEGGWEKVELAADDQAVYLFLLEHDHDRPYLVYSYMDMTHFTNHLRVLRLEPGDQQAEWADVGDLSVLGDWYPGGSLSRMSLAFPEGIPTLALQIDTPDGNIYLAIVQERNGEWVNIAERTFKQKPDVFQTLNWFSFAMDGQSPYLAYTRNELNMSTFTTQTEHRAERLNGSVSKVIGNGQIEPVMGNLTGLQLLKSDRDLYVIFTSNSDLQSLYRMLNLPMCEVVFFDSDQTELGRQPVICGELVSAPNPDPQREFHDFAGWYTDEDLTVAYDFNQPVESDLALYAKWERQAPPAPEQVFVKEVGDGYVKIGWSPSPGASRYNIYMSVTESVYGDRAAAVTEMVYTASGLENGTTYYFTVTAENEAGGESGYSVQVSATPERDVCTIRFNSNGGSAMEPVTVPCGHAVAEPDPAPVRQGYAFEGWYTDQALTQPYHFGAPLAANVTLYAKWRLLPPPVPDHVYLIEVGNGYAKIGWSPSPGASKYNIYMSVTGSVYSDRAATVTETVYTATGLKNGTTYYFTVTAENEAGGESGYSVQVSATPERDVCTIRFNSNGGSAMESITVPCGDGVAEPDSVPVRQDYEFEGWYTDQELTQPYHFGAPLAANMTLYAKWRLLPPDAPSDVIVFQTGDGYVELRWSPVPRAAGYNLYASFTPDGDPIFVGSVLQPVYLVSSLTNGVHYYFTVTAWNHSGESEPSSQVLAVPSAPPINDDDGRDGEGGQDGEDDQSGDESNDGDRSDTTDQTDGSVSDLTSHSVTIFVNGKAENAGTATTTEAGGRLTTVIVLDESRIEQKLNDEGEHAVITIRVASDSEVAIAELTGQIVKRLEEQQAVVEIQTDKAVYKIPAQNLFIDEIAGRFGISNLQEIKIQIEILIPEDDVIRFAEDAANSQGLALVVPPLSFSVRAINADQVEEISMFRAYVKRMVALPDDVEASRITTGVYIGPDGSLHHVPTRIVVMDGKTYAQINSITNSMYSVIWNQVQFKDAANHWSKDIVNEMGSRLIMNGYDDGTFRPDQRMTRAEFAALMVRGLGLRAQKESAFFTDVSQDDWYHDAVGTACAYGLISGFEDGRFAGNEWITREQAMAVIAKAMTLTNLQSVTAGQSENDILQQFTDSSLVSDWARRSVADAVQAGIVSGRGNKVLSPQDHLSRAEAAVLVQRLLLLSGLIDG